MVSVAGAASCAATGSAKATKPTVTISDKMLLKLRTAILVITVGDGDKTRQQ
jgi:hypothetical protein